MKALLSSVVVAAVLIISCTTPARALLISQQVGYGYTTGAGWNLQNVAWGVNGNGDIDSSKVLTFNKFDSSLGKLTGAQLNFYANASGDLSATNNSLSPLTISTLMNLVNVFYQPPSVALSYKQLSSPNLAPVNNLLAAGATYTSGNVPFVPLVNDPLVNPDSYNYDLTQGNLAAFIGIAGSTFDIPVAGTNDITITSVGANPTFNITNMAGVYATLAYTYEIIPVPEPSTFILLGSFFAVALVRKNKSQNVS
jgi:hypothetical protein